MADTRISASLSPADREAVMDAIATIKDKLPFLVDLTTEKRRTLPKMGDKSRAFFTMIWGAGLLVNLEKRNCEH
ncbi:hypothetical protein JYQ62_37400 [Nostoc sp. UHCC 0702]|nr:hypothetical protein JYQ62_37400 [Nostoc sp. UHCC 0702]